MTSVWILSGRRIKVSCEGKKEMKSVVGEGGRSCGYVKWRKKK